jgi:putative glutamine amidotransferase
MKPRIAIPIPHSSKPDYNERTLPHYIQALKQSGAEPAIVPLDATPAEIARMVTSCQGVLLPGSPADLDPAKYDAPKDPHTNPADEPRDRVDELLIQDAHNMRKPLFGICYGMQAINVWRTGTLVQHLPQQPVNHEAGPAVQQAHDITFEPASLFATIISNGGGTRTPVNSSHHQSVEHPGDGLRIVAHSTEDGVVEAVENINPDHWLVAVQWHPERTFQSEESSRKLFRAFVEAASRWHSK